LLLLSVIAFNNVLYNVWYSFSGLLVPDDFCGWESAIGAVVGVGDDMIDFFTKIPTCGIFIDVGVTDAAVVVSTPDVIPPVEDDLYGRTTCGIRRLFNRAIYPCNRDESFVTGSCNSTTIPDST
jgi:hypothetical protein